MTFLKSKSKEAMDLLLMLRQQHYSFVSFENTSDVEDFLEHFYKNQLQSKEWHIANNNRWLVIEFNFEDDIYTETIEKLLTKGNFSDRKVSLSMEAETIKQLRLQKTSINKLYRTNQFAFHYNYLFCLYPNESLDDAAYLESIRIIGEVFIKAAIKKVEPLYCIISADHYHMALLEANKEGFQNFKIDDSCIYRLSNLDETDITAALQKHELFRKSNDAIKKTIVEDILSGENLLLQLKNADRKLSLGILPTNETSGPVSLKITKDGDKKLSISKGEKNTTPAKKEPSIPIPGKILSKPGKFDLDKLYNSLGTRYQRDNFMKCIVALFDKNDADDNVFYPENLSNLSQTTGTPVKDIRIALHPLTDNKIMHVDAEDDFEDITLIETSEVVHWPTLNNWLSNKYTFRDLFAKVLMGHFEPETMTTVVQSMTDQEWQMLSDEKLGFWQHLCTSSDEEETLLGDLCADFINYKPHVAEIKPETPVVEDSEQEPNQESEKKSLKIGIRKAETPAATSLSEDANDKSDESESIFPSIRKFKRQTTDTAIEESQKNESPIPVESVTEKAPESLSVEVSDETHILDELTAQEINNLPPDIENPDLNTETDQISEDLPMAIENVVPDTSQAEASTEPAVPAELILSENDLSDIQEIMPETAVLEDSSIDELKSEPETESIETIKDEAGPDHIEASIEPDVTESDTNYVTDQYSPSEIEPAAESIDISEADQHVTIPENIEETSVPPDHDVQDLESKALENLNNLLSRRVQDVSEKLDSTPVESNIQETSNHEESLSAAELMNENHPTETSDSDTPEAEPIVDAPAADTGIRSRFKMRTIQIKPNEEDTSGEINIRPRLSIKRRTDENED